MDRRSFITGLAAGTAALAHTGLAQASTSEAFSKKTRPVDTMNRIGGWTNGCVYEAVLTEGRADIVDLELFRDRAMIDRLVKLARKQGVKVIISDHEFNFTPDEDEIIRRLMLEEQAGADILKIAVMAHSPEDALAVMSATAKMRHYHSARPMLTMAMGRAGVLTRITGEGFGSDMTFASVGGKASAPGQIPAEDCLRVLETLHKAMNP